ncbi:MAG: YhjD/YihY/BrkB family envelope integrity protein, partial [Ferruginibacter sp.]
MLKHFKNLGLQLREAFRLLVKNDPLRLAGATAFFTTFALPPILLILIQLLSLIFNRRTISHQLFTQLGGIVGRDSVRQLIETLKGFRGLASNLPLAILGFFFLLFVATTLFKVIQSSVNQLWMIRITGKKKFKIALVSRVKSVLVIAFTGLLFIASLIADSFKAFFGKHLEDLVPALSIYLNNTLATIISIA